MDYTAFTSVTTIFVASVVLILVSVYFSVTTHHHRRLPLPHGPKSLPLIGNALDVPATKPWLKFTEWGKLYGDFFYFSAFGGHVIVLNSLEAATDLIARRSAIYSGRPAMPMICDLVGWDFAFAFMQYGAEWRKHRTAFYSHFHPDALQKYSHIQLQGAGKLLKNLLSTPDDFFEHTKFFISAEMMNIAYGLDIQAEDDKYLVIAKTALECVEEAGVPGAFLVDTFPILKHIPSWVPGAGFKRKAEFWRQTVQSLISVPFDAAKEAMENGSLLPSVLTDILADLQASGAAQQDETVARAISALVYVGGADTSLGALLFFFYAMASYPDAQCRAQAELDDVVGQSRLPDFSDRPQLPYIEALVKELLRWMPIVPLAFPHAAAAEDEYRGRRIPKGATVIANVWAILHDPQQYEDPETFRPERFLKNGKLDPKVQDPDVAVFSLGPRKCPGRHLALDTLFIAVASILSTFRIESPNAGDNMSRPIDVKVSPGLVVHPAPFDCTVSIRRESFRERIIAI